MGQGGQGSHPHGGAQEQLAQLSSLGLVTAVQGSLDHLELLMLNHSLSLGFGRLGGGRAHGALSMRVLLRGLSLVFMVSKIMMTVKMSSACS